MTRFALRSAALVSTILTCACGGTTDKPGRDSGTPDAGDERDSGTPDAGGDEDSGTPDAGGDEDSGVVADTTPPTIVAFTPADGANQVYQELVTIDFSEPMNRSTVEAALAGTYTWSADDTHVEIAVSFPFSDVVQVHLITVPTTVTDVAGNALAEPYQVTITLAALQVLTFEYDATLSGNRSPGCSAGTFVMAGDKPSDHDTCPSVVTYGGMSFPIGALPPLGDVLAVRSAFVRTQVISTIDNPGDAALGDYVVDHVIMASRNDLTAPIFKTEGALVMFDAGGILVGELVNLDVTALLQQSWTDGDANFQLRFYPSGLTDLDAMEDRVALRRLADENDGIVDPALTEPDDANRLRLEVSYFE